MMFARIFLMTLVMTCCVCGLSIPGQAAPPKPAVKVTKPKLIVPAYFYPDGRGLNHWKQLMSAASKVPVIAIANPASGPGTQVDPIYTDVIKKAQAAKVKVIGYVSTSYAKRPIADVKADVDLWVKHYPTIQGIFFDEQVSAADQVDYYLELKKHTLSRIPKAFIVTNPGTTCAEEYFSKHVADTICIIEKGEGLEKYAPPAWAKKYPADQFYGLAYDIKKPAGMHTSIKSADKQHLGYLFITDDVLDNPWDTLPPYWDAEVESLK